MAQGSKIEWCHDTLNFWWGCTKKSEACANCYAETMDKMRGPLFDSGRVHWGPKAPRWLKPDSATATLQGISRKVRKTLEERRIFVNSMSDTFEDHKDLPPAREILFAEIEKHPWINFLLLTKRPENIMAMVPDAWEREWPAHAWIGTTVENQARADERIPELLKVPAAVRFLSCEPLLGPLNLELNGISWVICGGESGPGARPMHPDWARSLRDQCVTAGVPFLFKQWGEWIPADARQASIESWSKMERKTEPEAIRDRDGNPACYRVGKKAAGRMLDDVEWNQFPKI